MICDACGKKLDDNASFCFDCGHIISNPVKPVADTTAEADPLKEAQDLPEPVLDAAASEPEAVTEEVEEAVSPATEAEAEKPAAASGRPMTAAQKRAASSAARRAVSSSKPRTSVTNRQASSSARAGVAAAPVPAPGPRPAATSTPAAPGGAYVPNYQKQENAHEYSRGSGSSSSGWTPGRTMAIFGAIAMIVSMFLPCITMDYRWETESFSWIKIASETDAPAAYIMLITSAVAVILAFIDTKGTKIAYFIYSIYAIIFCLTNMSDMNRIMDDIGYFSSIVKRGIGYYTMILSACLILVAGIRLLKNLNFGYVKTATNISYLAPAPNLEQDYHREPKSNEWRCSCGKINPDYTGICQCGLRKSQSVGRSANPAPVTRTNRAKAAENNQPGEETQKIIEAYKELLDTGVITQEEFDEKKKSILGE